MGGAHSGAISILATNMVLSGSIVSSAGGSGVILGYNPGSFTVTLTNVTYSGLTCTYGSGSACGLY